MKEFKKSSLTVIVFAFLIIFVFAGFKIGGSGTDFREITGASTADCDVNSECGDGRACIDNMCLLQCEDKAFCESKGYEDNPPYEELLCSTWFGYESEGKVCIKECNDDSDCPPGDYCNEDNYCSYDVPDVEICDNGQDDDGDSKIDCADDGCDSKQGSGGTCEYGAELTCGDSFDNDRDGLIDCADPDCDPDPICLSQEDCDNGQDDDGDGKMDCLDIDCQETHACYGLCQDGIDNNENGFTDCNDVGCQETPYCEDSCKDGVDNDGDGLIDCEDSDLTACGQFDFCKTNLSVGILSPSNGSTHYSGIPVVFKAETEAGKNITYTWNASNVIKKGKQVSYTFNTDTEKSFNIYLTSSYLGKTSYDWITIKISPNAPPVANIYEPEDGAQATVERDIFFNARGSYDLDGNISRYIWDFGEKDKPWGLLEKYEGSIICKSVYTKSYCSYLSADYEGVLNPDVLGNPCTCPNLENGSDFIYPFTRLELKQSTIYKSYKDKNICTLYGKETTSKCTVKLTVYDDENETDTISIELNLIGESTDTCPDLVNDSHACGENETDLAYRSGNINCCCDNNFLVKDEVGDGVVSTFKSECKAKQTKTTQEEKTCDDYDDISECEDNRCHWYDDLCHPFPEEEEEEDVCGDGYCSGGENVETCFEDCHCGDGECQPTLGETEYTCSQDCKKASSGILYIIISILAISVIIVFFYLYKEGYFSGLVQRKAPSSKASGLPSGRAPGASSEKSNVKKYIQETRKKGYTYSQIKQKLMKSGWSEDEINEAFSSIK